MAGHLQANLRRRLYYMKEDRGIKALIWRNHRAMAALRCKTTGLPVPAPFLSIQLIAVKAPFWVITPQHIYGLRTPYMHGGHPHLDGLFVMLLYIK